MYAGTVTCVTHDRKLSWKVDHDPSILPTIAPTRTLKEFAQSKMDELEAAGEVVQFVKIDQESAANSRAE